MSFSLQSRAFSILLIGLAATGCTATTTPPDGLTRPAAQQLPVSAASYAAQTDSSFPIPAVDTASVNPENLRQQVNYRTPHPPGTIVVDTENRFVYLVQEDEKAMRYGVGVGREGLEFTGAASVGLKREWPHWTPTPNMIARQPDRYAQWAGGMKGGPDNPLGARALYLYKDGRDTLFRIHGTNEPHTIGQAVSSGCIRMMNQDIIDLYRRVPAGSKVVVI